MSTLTAVKKVFRFEKGDTITILPEPVFETPRQEILRLLDRAVQQRGKEYVDRVHLPTSRRGLMGKKQADYGCIMGMVVGLNGVSVAELADRGLDYYLERFGWVNNYSDRRLISEMIHMNDMNTPWGVIQKYAHHSR